GPHLNSRARDRAARSGDGLQGLGSAFAAHLTGSRRGTWNRDLLLISRRYGRLRSCDYVDRGKIQGGVVVLTSDCPLPEGTPVDVRPRTSATKSQKPRHRAKATKRASRSTKRIEPATPKRAERPLPGF